MNTRSQIPRGNKLFLPKIEYAKLSSEDRSFRGERPNVQPTLAAGENGNAVFENGEKIPLLNRDYSMGSFTRFSVLPPIKDTVRNGRRMSRSRRYSSGISFSSSNGPSPNQESNKKGDDARLHKYAEFSSVLVQQRIDSNADGNNLQVVGKPFARAKRRETRETGQRQFTTGRPPQRSLSSPVSSTESSCKGCQTLLRRHRSQTEAEKLSIDPKDLSMDALVHTCNKREELPEQVLARMSSGNIDTQNESHGQEKFDNRQSSGRSKDSTLTSKQSGSLQEQTIVEHDNIFSRVIRVSLLPIGPLQKGSHWACADSLFTCCGPFSRDCLDGDTLVHLKKCYSAIFDEISEESVTTHFERFASCRFNGDLFGSSKSRGDRSAFILARWCKSGGKIDDSGSDLRPGVVDFYMKQNVKVDGGYVSCILASVHWFQAHPARNSLGAPVEVWCKDLFEPEGDASFIPVQRIYGKFIPALDIVAEENVLVVCPLPSSTEAAMLNNEIFLLALSFFLLLILQVCIYNEILDL